MKGWTRLTHEPIESRQPTAFLREALATLGAALSASGEADQIDPVDAYEAIAHVEQRAHRMKDADDRAWGIAITSVLGDLLQQGWILQFRKQHLWGQRPLSGLPRDALRQRLLIRRDEQLTKGSVREFVRGMERWRLHRGERTSILSLMRDGRALAAALESATPVTQIVDPYVQFVSADGVCGLTGMRTQDIWRYFRHTWSSPYESVPGRSLQFIVRDGAAPFHPVIGIGALSSAAVRLGPRDRFIGWDTEQVIERLLSHSPSEARDWALKTLLAAVDEIYMVDLVRDKVLPADPARCTAETATACAEVAAIAKAQHHRLMEAREYKASDDVSTEEACVARAEMYLFRAKRALELSKLIPILIQLREGLPEGGAGRDLLSKVVRIARSKTVGTEIADLTVCGAIAPYSHLAAGKLVAMLAASPEVVAEYKRRYEDAPGIIASSMAGRPVRRPANLCYIGTTSLYGRRPNQYDRLSMPAQLVGGPVDRLLRYEHIEDETDSRTQGVGTFHFSSKTLKGLERLVSSRKGGWKVNNLFGEGTSAKLRGLRDGLIALDLHADELLTHGMERCMYGVKLADNVDRYLLGMDPAPHWVFDRNHRSTKGITTWWAERWAGSRAARPDIVDRVRRETLAYPIKHHARVQLPVQDGGQVEIM